MADRKMIIEYIHKGYPGKRIVKDGVTFIQRHRGPRIGVFVALNTTQFGWSLVHLKGEHRESPKDISWKDGVKMAIARAEGKTGEKVPDSIRKQFEHFKKRASGVFSEKQFPVEGCNFSIAVSKHGEDKQFAIVFDKKGRICFKPETFHNLVSVMQKALAENQES